MSQSSEDFSLAIEGVAGLCPSGERWAEEQIARNAIPVLSCEGPCIRGDIARLAANQVAKSPLYGRACYAETALVPHSAMARWVRQADKVVMIDGCFLRCVGRLMGGIVKEKALVQIDALKLHKQYGNVFHMDDVPEPERKETARRTADRILALLDADQAASLSMEENHA